MTKVIHQQYIIIIKSKGELENKMNENEDMAYQNLWDAGGDKGYRIFFFLGD